MKPIKQQIPSSMIRKCITVLVMILMFSSCEKFLEVDRLETDILAEQVFENDGMANAAINGIYKEFKSSIPSILSFRNATYSDEVTPYLNSAASTYFTNNLQPEDTTLPWGPFYTVIYGANNAIEKLSVSSGVPVAKREQYIAEAKFMRAMAHFYLTNFFGDVPLVLTSDLHVNRLIPRTSSSQVYTQILSDLKDAKLILGEDYLHAGNERIRANKHVVSAMLARVYLFLKDYTNAEAEANAVISSGKYSLLSSPVGIWNKNNAEAILQLANHTTEGNAAVASSYIYTTAPVNVLTPALLNAFEGGDLRKTSWIRTQTYNGQPVSIPYKLTTTATNPPEYYTLIRMAEMYLIRAETRLMRDDFQGCIDDINLIRLRHGGLSAPLPAPANRDGALTSVLHERQVDLFTEGCHRFFDLKRTDKLDATMIAAKPLYWKPTAALYPVPLTERQRNPNLSQNLGYQ